MSASSWLITAGVLVLVVAVVGLLYLVASELRMRRLRRRRALQRLLICHAAQQRMRELDRTTLSAMFDAVRARAR